MCKVSIIVPAYNIEEYISRCIESLTNQTFEDIEIIIVNDGSTDNTLEVIKEEAKIDKRIKIINKKNEGSIEARKSGIKMAKGDFILCIDGDDWIETTCIDKLYSTAKKEKSDIVCFNLTLINDNGKKVEVKQGKARVYEDYDFLKKCLLSEIMPSLCTKFIKKDFLFDNNVEFPSDFSFAEDLALTCAMAIKRPRVSIIEESYYYYYERESSITNKISSKVLEVKEVFEFIEKILLDESLYIKLKDEYNILFYKHCYYLRREQIIDNNEIGKQLYKLWNTRKNDIFNNKYYKKMYKDKNIKTKIITRITEMNYYIGIIYGYYSKLKRRIQ